MKADVILLGTKTYRKDEKTFYFLNLAIQDKFADYDCYKGVTAFTDETTFNEICDKVHLLDEVNVTLSIHYNPDTKKETCEVFGINY